MIQRLPRGNRSQAANAAILERAGISKSGMSPQGWTRGALGCPPRPTESSGRYGRGGSGDSRDSPRRTHRFFCNGFLPGDDRAGTGTALALLIETAARNPDLVVPQLSICEAGNTLARVLQGRRRVARIAFFGLDLAEAKLDARWRARAVSQSVRYRVALYDAAYHAVALGLWSVSSRRTTVCAPRLGGRMHFLPLRLWTKP